jgi:hypothetical protein
MSRPDTQVYFSLFDSEILTDQIPPSARIIKPIRVEIGGVLTSAQLKNLNDVKRLMVEQVRAAAGNAVVDFKYEQRSVGFSQSIFDRDDVHWYGEGKVARVE